MKAPNIVSGITLRMNCVVDRFLDADVYEDTALDVHRARVEDEAGAGLHDLHDDQSDDERERRHDLEVQQRAYADPADLLHRAGLRHPDDDGREDDRRDEHAHQLDEAVAERLHRGAVLRRNEAEQCAERDADEDLDIESRQVAACRPLGVRFLVHSL